MLLFFVKEIPKFKKIKLHFIFIATFDAIAK
jgi:hypothetical protein